MKTALDELMDFIEEGKFEFFSDIFDKAKEIKNVEEDQIKKAFENGKQAQWELDNMKKELQPNNISPKEYYQYKFGNSE